MCRALSSIANNTRKNNSKTEVTDKP